MSYLEVKSDTETWSNDNLQRQLSGWVYYHPVTLLYKKPKNISEHDMVDRY